MDAQISVHEDVYAHSSQGPQMWIVGKSMFMERYINSHAKPELPLPRAITISKYIP
jgi:hypothetical protein